MSRDAARECWNLDHRAVLMGTPYGCREALFPELVLESAERLGIVVDREREPDLGEVESGPLVA